ncbi:MAG: hypothetical protein AAB921_04145 [Patescibacteria group bacterium]
MSRANTLILLGVLVILTPFSGLPIAIRTFFAVIFGVCVFGIGLSMRAREVRLRAAQSPTADTPTPEPPAPPQEISPI